MSTALSGLARATQTRQPSAFAALTECTLTSLRADGAYATPKVGARVEVGPLSGSLAAGLTAEQVAGQSCLVGFPANGRPWLVSL